MMSGIVMAKPTNSEQVAEALENTGFILLRGAIGADALHAARQWVAAAIDPSAEVAKALQPVFEVNGLVRKIRRLTFHDPDFWLPWIEKNCIGNLASKLLGKDCVLILHAAFTKPARVGSSVVPHQDQALWDTLYPGALTMWISLENATTENGCLEMYPGSHKRGQIPHDIPKTEFWHEAIDIASQGLAPEAIPMNAGDTIIWHRYMAHSSGPNKSESNRTAMVMVFADAGDPNFKAYDSIAV